jgi:hypothetical protein
MMKTTDLENLNVDTRIGDGSIIKPVKTVTFHGTLIQEDGTRSKTKLNVNRYLNYCIIY